MLDPVLFDPISVARHVPVLPSLPTSVNCQEAACAGVIVENFVVGHHSQPRCHPRQWPMHSIGLSPYWRYPAPDPRRKSRGTIRRRRTRRQRNPADYECKPGEARKGNFPLQDQQIAGRQPARIAERRNYGAADRKKTTNCAGERLRPRETRSDAPCGSRPRSGDTIKNVLARALPLGQGRGPSRPALCTAASSPPAASPQPSPRSG